MNSQHYHTVLNMVAGQGYTVLVPNQRIREAMLRSYSAARPDGSWYTPDINAIDVWIEARWRRYSNLGRMPFSGLRLLGSIEESFIWLGIIEQASGKIPLLNLDEAATSAQQAYQLHRLWLDANGGENPPAVPGIPELSLFNEWATHFSQTCHEHRVVSRADATRILVRELQDGNIPVPDKLLMVNFYNPPPLYSRLFELLSSGAGNEFLTTAPAAEKISGTQHLFADFETEVLACARWAQQHSDAKTDQHIGIIYGGDSSRLSHVERAFRDVFQPRSLLDPAADRPVFNGPGGSGTLFDAGIVSNALKFLNLADDALDSSDFCHLLQSAELIGSESEREQRIQLDIYLRDNLNTLCSSSRLLRIMSREDQVYYCPLLAQALLKYQSLAREVRGKHTADKWVEMFSRQLEVMGWPGPDPDGQGSQSRDKLLTLWQQALASLAKLGTLLGEIDRHTALSRLRALCQKTLVRHPFSPGCQLSLYSLSDAVGLEFDHVWYLDFSDQSQPPSPSPSPFLLLSAQKQAGIPGSDSDLQLQLARDSFDTVCRSTRGDIHASYHRQDGDEFYRASSLIGSFEQATTSEVTRQLLNSLALASIGVRTCRPLQSDAPVVLQEHESVSGGQAVLSDQSSCPFRAFARHRLNARSPETFSNGLSARARGTAIHIALEGLFGELRSRAQLEALSAAQRDELVTRCAGKAMDFLSGRFPELMTPRFSEIEIARLVRLLTAYLELEAGRRDFQVIATEKPLCWRHRQLSINLKIDRLDRLDDGRLAVMDYKTGKTTQSVIKLLDQRPENLQLPVYFLAVSESLDEKVGAVIIAQLNTEKTGFSGLAAEDNFHRSIKSVATHPKFQQDWESLNDDWQCQIHQLADEFIHGTASVDPAHGSSTCTYCDLQPLCRIQELQPLQSLGDADPDTEQES